ncbi:NUDIX hydrolase [Candidatus Nitronereus thalassa]|uniref:GDP-mannose pyrophosphatase n=1 Tax=Candidatus Nitronereus thalassa TaxID=3020898 RepID=A0ABU3K5N2_9BACT|nr:NUDIX hydrolase [Candidatus Nitronereus thalassa]MDT7041676.1 NUDIX hydrolase [Candidatus Nitronereus thalassa]
MTLRFSQLRLPVFKPWTVLDNKRLLSVLPWFEIWNERVQLPDGRIIPDYYKITCPDASVIVPINEKGEVFVLRQYRHGVGKAIWGLPAGMCNEGESSLDCAKRELLEETGCQAREWVDLGQYVRDANRGAGKIHVFLARGTEKVKDINSGDLEEHDVQLMKMEDLLLLIENQQIETVGILFAILLARYYFECEG